MMIDQKTWATIQSTFDAEDKKAIEESIYGFGYATADNEKQYYICPGELQPELARKVRVLKGEI